MDLRLFSLVLLLQIVGCLSSINVSVTCENICALSETSVQLKCSYNNIQIKTVFWFSWKQRPNWRNPTGEPEDLTLDSDYSGRVKWNFTNSHSILTMSDVREQDSGEYQLMFIMKNGVKHLASNAVNLTVTVLQVKISQEFSNRSNLTCHSSCDLTSKPKNYYWKRDGQYIKNRHFKIITLGSTEADASYSCFLTPDLRNSFSPVCVSQSSCWDVTYTSRRVCALINSTVDFSCTYSHPSDYTVEKTFWHYVQSGDLKDLREEHQFAGRVEYVENKLRIKDLKMNDSGEYQFRIISDKEKGKYSGIPGVSLTVTDIKVVSSPDVISEGEKVILSCSTKCTLGDNHAYIWYKKGRQVTDGFTKANKLYLDSVSSEELQEFSCAVVETKFLRQDVYKALQTALIIIVVFLIVLLLGVLWYRRRKNKSSEQHKDTKEVEQPCSCPVYETVAPLSTVCTQQVHIKDQDVHYSSIHFKQSDVKNTSLVPAAVCSNADNVYYAAVKFS